MRKRFSTGFVLVSRDSLLTSFAFFTLFYSKCFHRKNSCHALNNDILDEDVLTTFDEFEV